MDSSPKNNFDHMILRCITKIYLNQTFSIDYGLHVLTPKAVPVAHYEIMCGAIDEMGERALAWCLEEIKKLENDEVEEVDSSTEAYVFFLRKDRPISFEFQYGENGLEKGGEVTLAQFKLAVQTYLQFLRDPERKPIEVPFPE